MTTFLAAFGLFLAFEGALYGLAPEVAKKAAAAMIGTPSERLRSMGLAVMAVGVAVLFLAGR